MRSHVRGPSSRPANAPVHRTMNFFRRPRSPVYAPLDGKDVEGILNAKTNTPHSVRVWNTLLISVVSLLALVSTFSLGRWSVYEHDSHYPIQRMFVPFLRIKPFLIPRQFPQSSQPFNTPPSPQPGHPMLQMRLGPHCTQRVAPSFPTHPRSPPAPRSPYSTNSTA